MKIKNLSFVIILLFFSNLSLAQQISISGKVLDSKNAPIEFANVLLQNQQDSTIQLGTSTALDGRFNFKISKKGTYEIVVSFIGYQDWEKELLIEKSVELEVINLAASTNKLGEVMVTSTRKIIERKEDKLVFNVAASPLSKGYDGMEVLQRSPNVVIDGESITLRNEAATVLINGRISNLNGENLANFIRNLRSDEIKSIEIQTNLSANTDAESSGGVVNIILKKKPIGFDGNVRTQNTFKSKGDRTNYVGTNFNNGAERWNIYGGYNFIRATTESVNESSIDYFESKDLLLEDGIWQNFRKRHNYQLGFGFDFNENHVFGAEFFGTDYNNQINNISLINLMNGGESKEKGSATLDGSVIYDLANFTLNYAWTIDTLGSKLQVFGDYTDQFLEENTEVFSEYEQGVFIEKRERNNTAANTKIYAVQADLEKYFLGGIKLETGSKWTFTDRANDLRSDNFLNNEWEANDRTSAFNYGEQVLAGYLSMSKKILEKNFFKLGLRVENTNLERVDITQDTTIGQNYTDWFPSFYFSRDLPYNNILSFSYSKRLRRPSFQFLNNSVIKINDFRYELGNPNLRPEYVHNLVVL